jgi:AcrR family transcriptional regulator
MPADAAPARRRPTGRRPGDSGSRDAILDAALDLFAEHGYDGASMRAIAAAAGVDPALIRHFFGDKETLFTTVVADRTAIPGRLAAALSGDRETVGERITDTYLSLWEEPGTRPILLALVRSAASSPTAASMLRELLGGIVEGQTGGEPFHAEAFALAGSHLFGLAVARHVLGLPALTALDHDTLVARVAPTVSRYLSPVPRP